MGFVGVRTACWEAAACAEGFPLGPSLQDPPRNVSSQLRALRVTPQSTAQSVDGYEHIVEATTAGHDCPHWVKLCAGAAPLTLALTLFWALIGLRPGSPGKAVNVGRELR